MLNFPKIDKNKYKLIEIVGEGGYGIVYKATQVNTGQFVAIKLLKINTIDQQSIQQHIDRFDRETKLCAGINHPNIVKLIDKGFSKNNEPFAVFEFIDGDTLKDIIAIKGGLPPSQIGDILGQVLDGLICAHDKGIVHRDLKPHNIMITQSGSRSFVKILDFGTSSFTSNLNTSKQTTLTNEVIGTPAYSAPEQLRGEPITTQSDLYTWGLIMLECFTGRPVIFGDSVSEVFQKQLDPKPIAIPPSIALHPIAKILKGVLQKNTNQRTKNVSLVANDFFKINFNTIVGRIKTQVNSVPNTENRTQTNQLAWKTPHSEKRLLTVLCVKLNLSYSEIEDASLDIETLEMILQDQLQFCKDTGEEFGAHISGIMADTITMYYGYPQIRANDARRAGRTALELMSQIQKRNGYLKERYNVKIDIRITINSGITLIKHKKEPEGLVINTAFNLLFNTPAETILVGGVTKKLLNPYLEFENFNNSSLFSSNKSCPVFLLLGEKHFEAFSNLSIHSADQKIIGRETEQKKLRYLWDSIDSSKGKAVLIKGQAGVGKSKIIFEGKKNLSHEKYVVRECYCQPEHQNSALYPFFELFKQDLGIQDNRKINSKLEAKLESLDCDLNQVIPVLCSWFSIPIEDPYSISQISSVEQKEILFDTLEKLVLDIDPRKKFLLIIEDLHWIDPTSIEFLKRLLINIHKTDYFLVLTSRPEFEIENDSITNLILEPLKEENTTQLIKNIIGEENEISIDALTYINDRTDGVPLFINDLTNMLLDQKLLLLTGTIYNLSDKITNSSIPITLEGLLNAQLDSVGMARESALLAAAIGREFDYNLLIKASTNEAAIVQQHLQILIDSKLIYLRRNLQNNVYIFRHALLKDAAYDRMVLAQKKEVHTQIAYALTDLYAEKTETISDIVALHFEKAQILDKALYYYEKAGDEAIKKSTFEQASLLFTKSLDIVTILTQEDALLWKPVKLRLLVQKSIALKPFKGWIHPEVIDLYNQAYKIGLELGEHKTIAPVTFGLWVKHLLFVELNEAEKFAKSYFETAKKLNEIAMMLEAKISISNTHFWLGDIQKSLTVANEVFDDFDAVIHKDNIHKYGQDPRAFAYLFKILSLNILGKNTTAITKEALDWATSLNHPFTEAIILQTIAWLHFQNQDFEEAKKTCDQLKEISIKHNFKLYLAVAHLFSTPYFIKINDFDKASEELETGYTKLLVKDNIIVFHSIYCLLKSRIEMGNKKINAALATIDKGIIFSEQRNESLYYPLLLHQKSLLLKILCKNTEAEEVKSTALKIALNKQYKLFFNQIK